MSQLDPKRRVVVTGLGVVSSIGIGWEEFWKNLLAGKSGISRVEAFDRSSGTRHFAGEVKIFDAKKFINSFEESTFGRVSQMSIVASILALEDAGLDSNNINNECLRVTISVGTTAGEIGLLEKIDDNFISKKENEKYVTKMLAYPSNNLSSTISKFFQFKSNNLVFATACASGNYALGFGFDSIKSNKSDYALVGGADGISRIVYTGFERLAAIAPEKCQPFDLNRQGMVPGEGSGMLLLETLESAQRRNAKVYAEVLGYGLSCDAHNMTNPDSGGVVKAIKKALVNSSLEPHDVDYISAHGTGTVENDKVECAAINEVFGSKQTPPTSSIKSMLGHTMGAASALESIACCLAIVSNEIPPTANFENFDPLCDIDCVPNISRRHNVKVALNNSQAFGGNNSCTIFKRCINE